MTGPWRPWAPCLEGLCPDKHSASIYGAQILPGSVLVLRISLHTTKIPASVELTFQCGEVYLNK